jgi:hypothetical protein
MTKANSGGIEKREGIMLQFKALSNHSEERQTISLVHIQQAKDCLLT